MIPNPCFRALIAATLPAVAAAAASLDRPARAGPAKARAAARAIAGPDYGPRRDSDSAAAGQTA